MLLKNLTVTILFAPIFFSSTAQDSLLFEYAESSKNYLFSNKDSAYKYLNLFSILSKRQNDSIQIAQSYKLFGIYNDIQAQYEVSLDYYDSSLFIFNELMDIEGKGDIHNNRAYLYHRTGQYKMAVDNYIEGIKLYESIEKKAKAKGSMVNLANTYIKLELHDKSKYIYQTSLDFFIEVDDHPNQFSCLIGLGVIYNFKKQHDSALLVYQKALNLNFKSEKGRATVLNNIGNVYNRQGKYNMAISSYLESLEIKRKIGDTKGVLASNRNIADTYKMLGQYKIASEYALNGYGEAHKTKDISLTRDFCFELADIYKELGKYQLATKYYEEYISLNDSLTNIQNTKSIIELEEKYKSEVSLRKISELKQEYLESENQKNKITFFSVALSIILIFTAYTFMRSRKTNQRLSNKNDQISLALRDKKLLLKEIHHRVKNNLQVISSLLNLQSKYVNKEAKKAVHEGRNRVNAMALIHQKLYQTDNLTDIQLPEYLSNLVHSLFDSYNIDPDKIKLTANVDSVHLDVDIAVPMGLIINELISNALKHAFLNSNEGELSINIKEANNQLELIVADNGQGFAQDYKIDESSSFGMRLVKILGERLGATFSLENNNGTTIRMTFDNYKTSFS